MANKWNQTSKTQFQKGVSTLNYPIIMGYTERGLIFGQFDHVFKLFWRRCGLEGNNIDFSFLSIA